MTPVNQRFPPEIDLQSTGSGGSSCDSRPSVRPSPAIAVIASITSIALHVVVERGVIWWPRVQLGALRRGHGELLMSKEDQFIGL